MKKVAIILIYLFLANNCFAQEAQKKDYYIFKNDDGEVTITSVSHFGRDGKKVVIITSTLTNPTLTDLSGLGVPEDAWKMISSPDAGVYSSRVETLDKACDAMLESNSDKQQELQTAWESKTKYETAVFSILVILVFCGFLLVLYGKKITIVPNKKPQPEQS